MGQRNGQIDKLMMSGGWKDTSPLFNTYYYGCRQCNNETKPFM